MAFVILTGTLHTSAVLGSPPPNYHATDLYVLTAPPGIISYNTFSLYGVPAAGRQIIGTGSVSVGNFNTHAIMWTSSGAGIDLHPTGLPQIVRSEVHTTDGVHQGGYGFDSASHVHALLWSSSAASAVMLAPAGYTDSGIWGIRLNQQVGSAKTSSGSTHAAIWNGSVASFADLHPTNLSGFNQSVLTTTDGVHQAGYADGSTMPSGFRHPMLWSGTADSAVDLSPSGLGVNNATVYGLFGNQQVGIASANSDGFARAILWNGTAASAVLLEPNLFGSNRYSYAYATNGVFQVGHAGGSATGSRSHAFLWEGTAASAFDLHTLLPAGYTESSAKSIDAAGNICGLATDSSGAQHAVMWSIPEPTTCVWSACALIAVLRPCRRRV